MRLWFVLGLLLSVIAAAEQPPACEPGLVRTPATRGHCCWQGQSWNAEGATCAGAPKSCPEGMAAFEDGCIAVTVSPAPVAAPAPESASAKPTFIQLPAGSFHYGCTARDTHCFGDEKPGREVTVASFRMMETETTVAAYAKCVQAGVCSEPDDNGNCNWQSFGRQEYPVNCVDWKQATTFCGWIDARLPTAEEWEFAAKGGGARVYPWGDEPPDDKRARFGPADGSSAVGRHPAGASRHGLQDMAGNVSEWTSSNLDSTKILIRGGSWIDGPAGLRSSFRLGREPTVRDYLVGFRCAK